MKYFSMFSGIGGFELGIQRAFDMQPKDEQLQVEQNLGSNNSNVLQRTTSCIGYSEIDRYAIQTYERHYEHTNYGSATDIVATNLPDFDLLVGGFPCQSFSVAGKRAGFNDTRGTLFFDIARILKEKRPRHLVLENVKGLLSHDSGKTFQTILGVLADLGYRVEWQVLNSKDFGVPQNRERVFFVGHLRDECSGQVFPIRKDDQVPTERQRQISPTITSRYYKQGQSDPYLVTGTLPAQWRRTEKGKRFRRESQKLGKDLTPFNDGHRELVPKPSGVIGAITSQAIAKDSLMFDRARIRRLTPLECERLQGFPDNWTKYGTEPCRVKDCQRCAILDINDEHMVKVPVSDTQRYKMAGNAVTVNTVQAVMEKVYDH